jgi:hypothetical protein
MPWGDVALLLVLLVFAVPILAILAEHKQKMAQIRLKAPKELEAGSRGEISELRQQLTDLRDLTTKYDLSFDQALQRIESRVAHFEQRLNALERGDQIETQPRRSV